MFDKMNSEIEAYRVKWRLLIDGRTNKAFFDNLQATSVGWKVADRADYDKLFHLWHDSCDQIVDVAMNGRWIAKMHLKEEVALQWKIEIIKLMLRRPDSDDSLGLDHIDFYSPEIAKVEDILRDEPGLRWTQEENDIVAGYKWISLWFDGTEAKLKSNTVIDVVIEELQQTNAKILGTQSE